MSEQIKTTTVDQLPEATDTKNFWIFGYKSDNPVGKRSVRFAFEKIQKLFGVENAMGTSTTVAPSQFAVKTNYNKLVEGIAEVFMYAENVNLVVDGKKEHSFGGSGTSGTTIYTYLDVYAYLLEGESYTFECETDGQWGAIDGQDLVQTYLMRDKQSRPLNFVRCATNPITFVAPKTGKFYVRIDVLNDKFEHKFSKFRICKGVKALPSYIPSILDLKV